MDKEAAYASALGRGIITQEEDSETLEFVKKRLQERETIPVGHTHPTHPGRAKETTVLTTNEAN